MKKIFAVWGIVPLFTVLYVLFLLPLLYSLGFHWINSFYPIESISEHLKLWAANWFLFMVFVGFMYGLVLIPLRITKNSKHTFMAVGMVFYPFLLFFLVSGKMSFRDTFETLNVVLHLLVAIVIGSLISAERSNRKII